MKHVFWVSAVHAHTGEFLAAGAFEAKHPKEAESALARRIVVSSCRNLVVLDLDAASMERVRPYLGRIFRTHEEVEAVLGPVRSQGEVDEILYELRSEGSVRVRRNDEDRLAGA